MGFVSDQRDKQIIGFARRHLDAGEEVLAWARAKQPGRAESGFARTGFLYITARKLIVHWAGQTDGHVNIPWKEISSWGVDREPSGGPVLGVETDEGALYVQMPCRSRKSTEASRRFIGVLADRAPKVREPLDADDYAGTFELPHGGQFDIRHPRRSIAGHTKRIVVTLLGIVLLVIGAVLTVLPGPAILFFIFGFAVLGSEYDWAQDALQWTKEKYELARRKIRERRAKKQGSVGRNPPAQ
jgi:hypothetical protein